MATNWSAYEAAKELYGNNKENIAEIGNRFPLFAKEVCVGASAQESILNILKAVPKVTARVVETGLKGIEDDAEEVEETQEKPAKKTKAKQPVEDTDDDWEDDAEEETSEYDDMTGKDLYALCCKRGISSQCRSRKKEYLIEMLTKLDNGEIESAKDKAKSEKKTATKKSAKKAEPVDTDDDDWDETEEQKDKYAGKTARELFEMCKKRGLKVEARQKADAYVKLLKADDAKADEPEDEEEDDDDWDI